MHAILAPTILTALATVQNAPEPSVQGQWRSPGGNSIIAIAPCGSLLCGTVAWASAQAKEASRKATSQLVGTQLLIGLQQRGAGWQGKLFIPDKNMHVTAKLQLVDPGKLKVSGCAAGRALCRSAIWTRADGPLPSSD